MSLTPELALDKPVTELLKFFLQGEDFVPQHRSDPKFSHVNLSSVDIQDTDHLAHGQVLGDEQVEHLELLRLYAAA